MEQGHHQHTCSQHGKEVGHLLSAEALSALLSLTTPLVEPATHLAALPPPHRQGPIPRTSVPPLEEPPMSWIPGHKRLNDQGQKARAMLT